MKKNKPIQLLFILFFLLPLRLLAQEDISGIWKGSLFDDTTKQYLPYEIAISDDDGKMTGYSYTVFKGDEVGIKTIRIKRKNDKIIIEDVDLIANNYTVNVSKKVRKLIELTLSVKDSIMIMSGKWKTNYIKEYRPVTGTIEVRKKNDSWKEEPLIKKLDEMQLSDNLSFVQIERRQELIVDNKQIEIKSASDKMQETTITDKRSEKEQSVNSLKDSSIKASAASVAKKEEKSEKKPTVVSEIDSSSIATVKQAEKEKVEQQKQIAISAKDSTVTAAVNQSKKERAEDQKPTAVSAKDSSATAIVNQVEKQKTEDQKPAVVFAKAPSATTAINQSQKEKADQEKLVEAKMLEQASTRKTAASKSLSFKEDSLVITLYDNGVVDGDTVSVFINGIVLFSKVGISDKPITKVISTKNLPDSCTMILFAENLGSIPPNTGLVIIYDGKKRNEIFFSADLQTNDAVILRRKKDY